MQWPQDVSPKMTMRLDAMDVSPVRGVLLVCRRRRAWVSAERGSAGPKQPTDGPDVVVRPRQDLHAVPRHAAPEERPPERSDAALPARLVPQEIPSEARR